MDNKKEGRSELAVLIDARLDEIAGQKMQMDVAEEVGFPNKNMLSIIKRGGAKLSLDRVERMAKSLELPLDVVMLPALRQYYTDDVIRTIYRALDMNVKGEVVDLRKSKAEQQILTLARQYLDLTKPLPEKTLDKLRAIFTGIESDFEE